MTSSPRALRWVFLLGALAFSLQIIPRWWGDSITSDEAWELTSSYYYWKTGDVWTPCNNSAP
ncbi:MAG TPA: hypothetical protein VMV05_03465, partial [bacterium]|nr:hypothetical protein [bacterium]